MNTARVSSGMKRFRSFNNSACKTVLNLLEAGYLRLSENVVKRIAVIVFGLYDGNDSNTVCLVCWDTGKLMTIIIIGFGEIKFGLKR